LNIWSVSTISTELHYQGSDVFFKQNRVVVWYQKLKALSGVKCGDLIFAYANDDNITGIGFAKSLQEHFISKDVAEEEWIYVNWIFKSIKNPISIIDLYHSDLEEGLDIEFDTNEDCDFKNIPVHNLTDYIEHSKVLEEVSKKA